MIAEERQRQIDMEGFTPEGDDQYKEEQLANAAVCYALPNELKIPDAPLGIWPWPDQWYKPCPEDRIRELQKAGALIAAEIDRLKRLQGDKEETQVSPKKEDRDVFILYNYKTGKYIRRDLGSGGYPCESSDHEDATRFYDKERAKKYKDIFKADWSLRRLEYVIIQEPW